MGFSDQEESIFYSSIIVSNTLSIIGSLFVCAVYLIFKEIRVFSFKLVVMMCIADCIMSLALLVPGYYGDTLCRVTAFLNSYGSTSSIIWNAIIAYCLYRTVFFQDNHLETREKRFLLVGFGIPIIISVIPFVFHMYGEAEGWCWIKMNPDNSDEYALGISLRLILFYIPLWIIIPVNLYIYARVIKHIQEEIEYTDEQAELRKTLISKLSSYPIILCICFLPATVKRLYDLGDPDSEFVLTLIAGCFVSFQGLFNAVIYGMTRTVRIKIMSCCRKYDYIEQLDADDSISVTRRISLVRVSSRNSGVTSV